jgi:hypothetical protein
MDWNPDHAFPLLLRIASAYEAATKFGPLP